MTLREIVKTGDKYRLRFAETPEGLEVALLFMDDECSVLPLLPGDGEWLSERQVGFTDRAKRMLLEIVERANEHCRSEAK